MDKNIGKLFQINPFSAEKAKTTEALEIIQKIAQSVNGEMKDYERTKQLEDIITNIERTSSTRLNEKRFNRKHLNQYGRQLINAFEVQYKVKEKVGQKKSFINSYFIK